MMLGQHSLQLSSRYVAFYDRLFHSLSSAILDKDATTFWDDLFSLDVDRDYLAKRLRQSTKDDCLDGLKPFLNTLFTNSSLYARTSAYNDVKKTNAIETLSILTRCILEKNLAGWEVMEVFAGSVNKSDPVFMNFVSMIDNILCDENAPASTRHQVLQLAVTFMCSINQLSPGAYFLRRDLFPSISAFTKSPGTEQYTFEAALLLSLLSNFHRSDAAKLNPYTRCIRVVSDKEFLNKICWASNFAADASIKAYQGISDDSPPTMMSTFGSFLYSLRPDHALASAPVDPPRHLFKDQPIEATIILLPVFEFLYLNPIFAEVLLEQLQPDSSENTTSGRLAPLSFTILTLSSYLLTHASSVSSPRAMAYANLCLNILLSFAEKSRFLDVFSQPAPTIRLCRQRLPLLPLSSSSNRPPIGALLDCCLLWLRHNLHKRFDVPSYTMCIRICYRLIWILQDRKIHLNYMWQEFWKAVLGLLAFLSTKFDSLTTTGSIRQLIEEAIGLLDLALYKSDSFMPNPQAVHAFVYELVHSSSSLKQQESLLETLTLSGGGFTKRNLSSSDSAKEALVRILGTIEFYEDKIAHAKAHTARDAMRAVAKEIDANGLHGIREQVIPEPPKHSQDVLAFVRYACMDGLSLMP